MVKLTYQFFLFRYNTTKSRRWPERYIARIASINSVAIVPRKIQKIGPFRGRVQQIYWSIGAGLPERSSAIDSSAPYLHRRYRDFG